MRRLILASGLALALISAGPVTRSQAAVDVDVHFGTGQTFWFERQPSFTLIPETRVYYVSGPDYEVYRYGSWYYVNNGGHWYRARSYRGPFRRMGYGNVPRPIIVLPAQYHRYEIRTSGRDPWQSRWGRGRDWNRDGYQDRNSDGYRNRKGYR